MSYWRTGMSWAGTAAHGGDVAHVRSDGMGHGLCGGEERQSWVKMRKARGEQISSEVAPTPDITATSQYVA